jgi:hypothetical protein
MEKYPSIKYGILMNQHSGTIGKSLTSHNWNLMNRCANTLTTDLIKP